jgi:acetate kinase
MSFTPLDGLIMGTRSGNIDPGAVIHMMQKYNLSTEDMQNILYKKSGLSALSDTSNDMRQLMQNNSDEAKFAIDAFVYSTIKYIYSMISALQGVDALIFSGGIGSNAHDLTTAIASSLNWLGLQTINPTTDEFKINNTSTSNKIIKLSTASSLIDCLAIKVNEEEIISQKIYEYESKYNDK